MKNKPIDALNFKTGPTSSGITVNQEGARTIHEITEVQPTLAIRLEFPQYNYYTCHQEDCEGRDYQNEEQEEDLESLNIKLSEDDLKVLNEAKA